MNTRRLSGGRRWILTVVASAAFVSMGFGQELINGKVAIVIDATTVEIQSGEQNFRAHLYGLLPPQAGSPHIAVSIEALKSMTAGKTLLIGMIGVGADQLPLIEIMNQEGASVNRLMVRHGHAGWDRQGDPGDKVMELFENVARKEGAGVWKTAARAPARPGPVPTVRPGRSLQAGQDQPLRGPQPSRAQGIQPGLPSGSGGGQPVRPGAAAAPPPNRDALVYFRNKDEQIYHKDGCRELKYWKTEKLKDIDISRDKLEPCSSCKPHLGFKSNRIR